MKPAPRPKPEPERAQVTVIVLPGELEKRRAERDQRRCEMPSRLLDDSEVVQMGGRRG